MQKFHLAFEIKTYDEYEWGEEISNEWSNAKFAKRLSLSEFLEFLDLTQDLRIQDELYVRMKVLWSFNDRVRQNTPQFNTYDEEIAWNWNIVRLIELLDWNKSESRLFAAELIRYLEEWDFAIEILNSINDSRLHPFSIRILNKCKEQSNLVFQF